MDYSNSSAAVYKINGYVEKNKIFNLKEYYNHIKKKTIMTLTMTVPLGFLNYYLYV